jgi:nucleotide-binding universal stress UspA family protein
MKTIIAGTDFTPSSVNACKYAALLAEKLQCKLTLFNMFEAPIIHSNVGLYGFSYASAKTKSKLKTYKVVDQLKKIFPELEINIFVSNNNFKSELENLTASHKVEAAVMGLEAKNRISKFIYGSHGVSIAGKIDAPVIIVPEKYKKHKLSNILLAVDNTEKVHKSPLRGFERFLNGSKARLQLVHVRTEDEILNPVITTLTINGKKTSIETVKAKDLQEGVKKYCREKHIDLIALVSKKHSVFYNLFVESNTKKVAFTAKVPVLAIHG